MEISTKKIILFSLIIIGYVYLSDLLKTQSFQEQIKEKFSKFGTNNTMAALISSTSVGILNSLPVKIFLILNFYILINFYLNKVVLRDPKKVVIGFGVAAVGMLMKNLKIIDFGFQPITTEPPENKN